MTRAKQLKLLRRQYESQGYTVHENPDLSMIGLTVSVPVNFLCIVEEHSVIVTVLTSGAEVNEDEEMARFDELSAAIKDRPDIEWEIRFFDISEQINKLEEFVKGLAERGDEAGVGGDVYEKMKSLGLAS